MKSANAIRRARYAVRHPERIKEQERLQRRNHVWTPEEREARRLYAVEWRKAHPGYCAKKTQEWKAKHSIRFRELCERWKKTPKGIKVRRAWDRSVQAKKGKKLWRAKNPEKVKAIERRRNHTRRARVNVVPFSRYDFAEILARAKFQCAYLFEDICRWLKNSQTRLEVDHLIPISLGGGDVAENILPACRTCNASKGNKLILPKFLVSFEQQKMLRDYLYEMEVKKSPQESKKARS